MCILYRKQQKQHNKYGCAAFLYFQLFCYISLNIPVIFHKFSLIALTFFAKSVILFYT